MEATQASGAGVGGRAGGSRSEEVRRRVTGQGGVVPGGDPRSGPSRGVEIHGGGTRGAGATNNGGRLRREERLRHAEHELKVMGGALMTSASILMHSISQTLLRPPAWVSEALQSGEQHYRASFYIGCNMFALTQAAAVLSVVLLYQLKMVRADRALPAAKVTMLATLVCIAMSSSVGGSEDWRVVAATFLALVTGPAIILFLVAIGKL